MQFRKKPVVIEATQWFKNGDHPQDNCVMVHPDPNSTTQFAPFQSEGKVVRYFRHPEVPDDKTCLRCGVMMISHGWVDTLEGGHIVCPGDWIITGVKGEHYPCKPEIFALTYESADVADHEQELERLREIVREYAKEHDADNDAGPCRCSTCRKADEVLHG